MKTVPIELLKEKMKELIDEKYTNHDENTASMAKHLTRVSYNALLIKLGVDKKDLFPWE
jgi:hypothetical protein